MVSKKQISKQKTRNILIYKDLVATQRINILNIRATALKNIKRNEKVFNCSVNLFPPKHSLKSAGFLLLQRRQESLWLRLQTGWRLASKQEVC
jgi:hypothetical protein